MNLCLLKSPFHGSWRISGSQSLPIGQVLFIPREEFALRDCGEEELAAIRQSRDVFSSEKAALTRNTAFGLP